MILAGPAGDAIVGKAGGQHLRAYGPTIGGFDRSRLAGFRAGVAKQARTLLQVDLGQSAPVKNNDVLGARARAVAAPGTQITKVIARPRRTDGFFFFETAS